MTRNPYPSATRSHASKLAVISCNMISIGVLLFDTAILEKQVVLELLKLFGGAASIEHSAFQKRPFEQLPQAAMTAVPCIDAYPEHTQMGVLDKTHSLAAQWLGGLLPPVQSQQ